MKKFAISIVILMGVSCAQAQSTPFFGHYMFNPVNFNPAWAAGEDKGFVAFQHRSQWFGYSSTFDGSGGAPNTQMLTVLAPIKNFPISTVGINLINDNLGPITNLEAGVPLTFSKSLKSGLIGIGATPILFSQTLNGEDYRPNEPDDPFIPLGGRQTEIAVNLNAGLFYRSNKGFFVGAGIQNILEPGFDFGVQGLENKLKMTYAAHAGYTVNLRNALTVSPTVLVRSDLNNYSFDLGGIITIGERVWTGISYRRQESAILYLGYALMDNKELKVGYSFDYVFVDQDAKAATTHELFLRYDLPNLVFGGKKKVKTPRFSF